MKVEQSPCRQRGADAGFGWLLQSNLDVLDWSLSAEDFDAISSLTGQGRLVDGSAVRPNPCDHTNEAMKAYAVVIVLHCVRIHGERLQFTIERSSMHHCVLCGCAQFTGASKPFKDIEQLWDGEV